MQIDVDQIEAGSTVRKPIVIVGAGAAGITLARRLGQRGLDVALLEGGGFQHDPKSQVLYAGPHSTNAFADDYANPYLIASRQRFFGGSTNCWAGWCVPLDPWDFEERPWLENSGWPFGFQELAAYYDQASHELEVKEFSKAAFESWFAHFEGKLILDTDQVKTRVLHRSFEVPRFNTLRRDEVLDSPHITLMLNSNVLEFECNAEKTAIQRVRVSTLEGNVFYVEADQFILATGGLENPRMLLASRSSFPEGLGNQHDLVGRYFMEHLELRYIADLFLVDPEPAFGLYFRLPLESAAQVMYACFSLSEKALRDNELYNCSFYLNFKDETLRRSDDPLKEQLWHVVSRVEHLAKPEKHPKKSSYLGSLTCRTEHAPHPDNRVTLDEKQVDAFGIPAANLKWVAQEKDYENVYKSLEILAREFGTVGKGRLKLTLRTQSPDNPCFGGPHHMGTTRMHDNPKKGVVDADCKVHGIDNLYVAGSSVFPTGGFANPTLTIVALALRLADHLHDQRKGEA